MVVPMNKSDASAVRRLLTATQRYAARAAEAARRRQELGLEVAGLAAEEAPDPQPQRYQYRFDDFENFDEESDDERDFRDLAHYATIDPSSGRVTELWLGIIDVYGIAARNGGTEPEHWKLSEEEWSWLTELDRLEHLKLTGCGALPRRQLKELPHLKHLSCSECGNLGATSEEEEEGTDLTLPSVESLSLRCGFQPSPDGVAALKAMFGYVHQNLTNLERITIWRLDQFQWRGHIPTTTTSHQRQHYKRVLVETLLEELAKSQVHHTQKVKILELNRCGLNSEDFKRLVLEILPTKFPSLQRLSVSSNDIEAFPALRRDPARNEAKKSLRDGFPVDHIDEAAVVDESSFAEKKRLFLRLRKNLRQIHLSNNPVMDFLGTNGDDFRELSVNGGTGEGDDQEVSYRRLEEHRGEEEAVLLRRSRRVEEFEKLRDWLRVFPKLSQLACALDMHNLMRSTTEDFVVTSTTEAAMAVNSLPTSGNGHEHTNRRTGKLVPFRRYSKQLQRQIEYYLRVNRGGRWLIDGHGSQEDACSDLNRLAVLQSLSLWSYVLEWSYRTSSSGCFLVMAQSTGSAGAKMGSSWSHSSTHRNATALYHLLREGPALCGGTRRE